MKLTTIFLIFAHFLPYIVSESEICLVKNDNYNSDNCITFTVSSGTGCAWMCNYCASNLGTNNYFFTDNVCTYQQGIGCVGNPIVGKSYTCCGL